MAFALAPSLDKCTTEQIDRLSQERAKLGFHCYYTGGFDARKNGFYVILPALMENGNMLTVLFEFIGDENNNAGLCLGRINHSTVTYAALDLTDRYGFRVSDTPPVEHVAVSKVSTPVQGTHVLQYFGAKDKIEVYLDGVLLVPADSIKVKISEHIVFSLGPGDSKKKTGPFVFHELHYTMADPGDSVRRSAEMKIQDYAPKFCFFQWIRLGRGGFILFDGEWTPGTDVDVRYGRKTLATHTAPPDGRMAILLKGYYYNGINIIFLDGGSNPEVFVNYLMGQLPRILVADFQKIFEYKLVTGDFDK